MTSDEHAEPAPSGESEQSGDLITGTDALGADATAAPNRRSWSMGASILLVVLAIIAGGIIVVVASNAADAPETREFRIAAGTADRIEAGEELEVFPTKLDLSVGDRLVIANEDSVVHLAGPYAVRPGETLDITYTKPAIYPGPCSLNRDRATLIVIT